jgi:hypothetical protein
MKRILFCLLLLPLCLALAPAAWASWGSFVSTGSGTILGTPSFVPRSRRATSLVLCGAARPPSS